MISTVTISTISTITTIATLGFAATIGVAAAVALIAFLTAKELAIVSAPASLRIAARFLNVAIAPIFVVFAVITAVKLMEVFA